MRYLAVVLLAVLLMGCTPETVFVYASCEIDDIGYTIDPNGDDLRFAIDLWGVDCD